MELAAGTLLTTACSPTLDTRIPFPKGGSAMVTFTGRGGHGSLLMAELRSEVSIAGLYRCSCKWDRRPTVAVRGAEPIWTEPARVGGWTGGAGELANRSLLAEGKPGISEGKS